MKKHSAIAIPAETVELHCVELPDAGHVNWLVFFHAAVPQNFET